MSALERTAADLAAFARPVHLPSRGREQARPPSLAADRLRGWTTRPGGRSGPRIVAVSTAELLGASGGLGYCRGVQNVASPGSERVRAAEVIAALCLATDLGTWLPFEHGLHSTLVAMRLGERLGVDRETARQTYYACLLF
jgi:hypothetical protein